MFYQCCPVFFLQLDKGMLILHTDYLAWIKETIEGLSNKLRRWKHVFMSKGLNVNFEKNKVIDDRGITKVGSSKNVAYSTEFAA